MSTFFPPAREYPPMKPAEPSNRRQVLATGVAASVFTIVPRHVLGGAGYTLPEREAEHRRDRRGRHGDRRRQERREREHRGLCDVDKNVLDRNAKLYPKARLLTDYRKMLETQEDIDAVVIATPDHTHAVIAMMAIKMGKHVHCQKPLTHSVYEARALGKARESQRSPRRWVTRGRRAWSTG